MYRPLHFIAALALVAACASTAWANGEQGNTVEQAAAATGHAIKSGAEAAGHAIERGAESAGKSLGLSESDRRHYEAHECGERQLHGKVATIDHDSGRLSLAGDTATYELHFPPKTLSGVATGDQLVVANAFSCRHPKAAGKESERPAAEEKEQKMRGEHWMTGHVTDVDAANGMVDVKTDEAPLKLQFTSDAARQLKKGEAIAVELAFREAPQTSRR